jgi:hypothetical protein
MTGPSTDLSGTWDIAIDTMTGGMCPGAPPDHAVGCQAFGVVTLDQAGVAIAGTAVLSGACQDCGSVVDFRDLSQPVVGSLEQSHLEFAIGGRCTFTGQAIDGQSGYSGHATCPVEGVLSSGRWEISGRR